jgi:hypothetical protein
MVSAPYHCAAHSHTTDAPHPRKRTAEPSKGGRTPVPRLPRTTPCRQTSRTRLLRHCRSCADIPAITTPSHALQRHTRRCGGTGRQDAATLAALHPTASRQLHPQVSVWTTTKREISTPPPSKPPQDGHRARHDAPPEARFARTVVHSVALSAMPSHVARTVRHACKLPPSWPIKGGAVQRPQGDDGSKHTRTLTALSTILALAPIKNL